MCNTILESSHSVQLYKNKQLDTFDFLRQKYWPVVQQNIKYIFVQKVVFYYNNQICWKLKRSYRRIYGQHVGLPNGVGEHWEVAAYAAV